VQIGENVGGLYEAALTVIHRLEDSANQQDRIARGDQYRNDARYLAGERVKETRSDIATLRRLLDYAFS
jgi:hypothetical protein